MKFNKAYDISVFLGTESIDYPKDTPFEKKLIWSLREKDSCDVSKLVMSAHSGTHIDMPAHFIFDADTLDDYEINEFIMPAQVVEITDNVSIKTSELITTDIKSGSALLFKTWNSMSGLSTAGTFTENFVSLSPEAADFCIEKNVKLVGIDYITIEEFGNDAYPVHRKLLSNNVLILEGIDLKNVPVGNYWLICLPLKIKGGEASPVRAVLIK